jgi:hypothetical protein
MILQLQYSERVHSATTWLPVDYAHIHVAAVAGMPVHLLCHIPQWEHSFQKWMLIRFQRLWSESSEPTWCLCLCDAIVVSLSYLLGLFRFFLFSQSAGEVLLTLRGSDLILSHQDWKVARFAGVKTAKDIHELGDGGLLSTRKGFGPRWELYRHVYLRQFSQAPAATRPVNAPLPGEHTSRVDGKFNRSWFGFNWYDTVVETGTGGLPELVYWHLRCPPVVCSTRGREGEKMTKTYLCPRARKDMYTQRLVAGLRIAPNRL